MQIVVFLYNIYHTKRQMTRKEVQSWNFKHAPYRRGQSRHRREEMITPARLCTAMTVLNQIFQPVPEQRLRFRSLGSFPAASRGNKLMTSSANTQGATMRGPSTKVDPMSAMKPQPSSLLDAYLQVASLVAPRFPDHSVLSTSSETP